MFWNRRVSILILAIVLFGCGHQTQSEPVEEPRGLRDVAATPVSELRTKRGGEGNKVYVPCYSHIRVADGQLYNLAINLSIRNTSSNEEMTVTLVDFFDSSGALVKHHASHDIVLKPLESADFYISEKDAAGGVSANFVVEWDKSPTLSKPIIEAVMVGTGGGQGISFVSKGEPIE